jgi:hypothetical protein
MELKVAAMDMGMTMKDRAVAEKGMELAVAMIGMELVVAMVGMAQARGIELVTVELDTLLLLL